MRTFQRWHAGGGLRSGDRRPLADRPVPVHALSAQEREEILRVANEPLKYLGGPAVVAAAATVLVINLVDGSAPRAERVLSVRALRWLGTRSYAIYLWHFLFVTWTNPLPRDVGVPVAVLASLVAGELSWRLVERPANQRVAPRPHDRVPTPVHSIATENALTNC